MAELTLITFPDEATTEFDIDAETESVAASAGGDTFRNSGKVGFWAKNTSGSPRVLTFDAPKNCNHGFAHDQVITVADGFEGFVKIDFDSTRFQDSTGLVTVTYNDETGLDVAAVLLP